MSMKQESAHCRALLCGLAVLFLGMQAADLSAQTLLAPSNVTAQSYYAGDDRAPGHTIDGTGMTPNNPVATNSTCGTGPGANMWLSNGNKDTWITFDLGGTVNISGFHLWNYNESGGFPGRGVKTCGIYTGTNLLANGTAYASAGPAWGTLVQNFTFTVASGLATYTGADYAFSNMVSTRYIQIYVTDNFGTSDSYTGLSEIRFYRSVSTVQWANPVVSNITCTSATASATLTVTGDSNAVATLYWGTTDQGQTNSGWTGTNVIGTVSTGLVANAAMAGLTSNTVYYYRFHGTNSLTSNESYSAVGTFTTEGGPEVNNGSGALHAGLGKVKLSGNLTKGKVADVYVYWGSTNGGQSTGYENVITMTGTVQGAFSTNLTFGASTSGYYICFASNAYGTAWSPWSTNFSVYMWDATNGGNHEGVDWIVTNGTTMAGTHYNVGRLVVSNGVTATLAASNRLVVTAATVEVYGTILGDGKGYGSGTGPGAGTTGADHNCAGGGGYGGAGGAGDGGKAGGAAYGTPDIATATLYPTNWGSGGGSSGYSPVAGGSGGGAIHLVATNSGTMIVNGLISAKGSNGVTDSGNAASGAGAGGSIWLECGNFSGTGTVTVVGGIGGLNSAYHNAGGGGGGRIAVHFTNTTFVGTLTANGGMAYGGGDVAYGSRYGQKGTIYVSPVGWIPLIGGDHGGADWIITNNTILGGVHYNVGRFAVSNGATVSLYAPEATFAVTSTAVEVYGTIDGNAAGSVQFVGPGAGTAGVDHDPAGGGGYGGAGGAGDMGRAGGPAWGTPDIATATLYPTNWGSAGGYGGYSTAPGGAGGGAIRLVATNDGTILLNGTITAQGGSGTSGGASRASGGGAGGSVWLSCGLFAGTGTVTVVGGSGSVSGTTQASGGGGGGRIAAHCTNMTFTGALTAEGGSAPSGEGGSLGAKYGSRGTIYLPPIGWTLLTGGNHNGENWLITDNVTVSGIHYNIGRFAVSNGVTATLAGPYGSFAVTAATVEVHGTLAGSSKGSPQTTGPGAGTIGVDWGAAGGGGFGGAGGMAAGGRAGGIAWGSPDKTNETVYPDEVGSGGGYGGHPNAPGGSGGGAIHLVATNGGDMIINGTVAANGSNGIGTASGANTSGGGGSGGSIWLECGVLSGSGVITAVGGNGGSQGANQNGGGGGGGRIAAHFTNNMFTGSMTVNGGSALGPAVAGEKGTIYVPPGNWTAESGGDHGGADWIITNNATVFGVHFNVGRFAVSNGATVTVLGPMGYFAVTSTAAEVYGVLTASGKGFGQGTGTGAGTTGSDHNPGGGGGYGGAGGIGDGGNSGGSAWGTPDIATATVSPTNFGSGGGSGGDSTGVGGSGGGAIHVVVTNAGLIVVDGAISSQGNAGVAGGGNTAAGGGSGGSIWLECGHFRGTGVLSVAGGAGGRNTAEGHSGGGGGGGRIAVNFTSTLFTGVFDANGGATAGGAGATLSATSGKKGTIFVTPVGWIPSIGGDHEGADWILTNNTTVGGTHYNVGRFAVSNGVTGTVASVDGIFAVTSAVVAVYGTLTADSTGNVRCDGTGKGTDGLNAGSGGGGYGGAGGNSSGGKAGGSAWGTPDISTATMYPTNCGSGGGSGWSFGYGGAGGGSIHLVATNYGAMTISGIISANGSTGVASSANVGGGGSGGSIWLECGQLSGSGTVRAAGGNGGSGTAYGGGGGGGRIAAYYYQTDVTFTNSGGTFNIAGGTASGAATAGGAGTLYLSACSRPAIDNAGGPTNVSTTSAWLNGTLLFTGGVPTEVWIYWGGTDGGTSKDNWATNIYMGMPGTGLLSQVAADMLPGTQYFYRCYATNAFGDAWAGSTFGFETLSSVTASNGPATRVTQTNATLSAGLTSGGFGELRIYWGLADGDTNAAAWQNTNNFGTVQAGSYSVRVAVRAGGPYFYRVYATNALSEDWADTTAVFTTPLPAVSLTALPATPVAENGGQATVTAALSAPSVSNVTVNFSFSGTAVKDTDYTSSADSVTITAGTVSSNITLTAIDDAVQEEDETMTVGILSLINATNGSPSVVNPTITSDDLEVSNGIGASGLAPTRATLNGVLTKGDSATIKIFWGDNDGGTSLTAWDSTNVMGVRTEDVAFATNITGLLAQKIYYYRCYATNTTPPGEAWATNTVVFAAPMPAVTLTNLPVTPFAETGAVSIVAATLSAISISNVTVNFSFGGTALKGTDYVSSADSVVIPAGSLSSNITLTALDDALQEDDETIAVGISSLVNATNGSPSSVNPVITSDDPEVTNGGGATSVGQTNATLNGVLTKGDSAAITIFWGDNDGGTTFNSWDSTNALGVKSEGTFSNKVTGLLANKTYYYRCYSTNSSLLAEDWADSTASFITTNPAVSINDVSITEGDSNSVDAVFTIALSALSAVDVSVTCTTSNGTAAAGADYVATNVIVLIPAGQAGATFTVKVLGDKLYEPSNEVFYVNMTTPGNCTISDAQGACTILDDDLVVHLADWRHKMKITFGGYTKPETLTNFPALVELERGPSGFNYTGVSSPVGGDLRFADSSNLVLLSHEIESWDIYGRSYVWVQIPKLVDSNTYIWAYWGNPNGTNPPAYTTNGAAWSQGFTGVWHCAQSSGTTVSNARPAGVKGTIQNAAWNTSGKVGSGIEVYNADPGVSFGALGFGTAAPRTISGWVKQSVTSPVSRSIFGFSAGTTCFDIGVNASSNWVVYVNGWEGIYTTARTDSVWYYLSATYDGSTIAAYMDGKQYTNTARALTITDNFKMGDRGGWAGCLDEVRVSAVARSANWEWASWMTVASNRVFCVMLRIDPEGTTLIVR